MDDQVTGISFAAILHLFIAIPICGHILLNKEQPSAAIAWIGVVTLSPFVGPALYWFFGINRIQRRARRLHSRNTLRPRYPYPPAWESRTRPVPPEAQLFHLGEAIHAVPFVGGNTVMPLMNGDAAYPAMLDAIARARHSIALSSYIFDYDATGERFVAALTAAANRGVAVRVLLDDFGTWYSPRSIARAFKGTKVRTARFLSGRLRDLPFINLRNHRKILVIDGQEGFIGGMNIRHGNALAEKPASPVQDIHFRVQGPVLDQLNSVFENDWTFASGEAALLPSWHGEILGTAHDAFARVITNGPDEALDKLQLLLAGALATCRTRVAIMTPYFLPNETLVSALSVAALRGVDVELILPEVSNIRPMGWAMQAVWGPLVMHGVRVTLTPPPFDHSKVLVVDGTWVLVGSTNWDQRSLRLNFEANLECYDGGLGTALEAYVAARRATGRRVTREDVVSLSLPLQLRNSFFRLFASYL